LRFPEPIVPSSLYTTAGDYARFITALLADAEILRLTTTAPVTVDGRLGLEWGLGWGLERGGDGLNLWHWGSNPGYRSFVMVSQSPSRLLIPCSQGITTPSVSRCSDDRQARGSSRTPARAGASPSRHCHGQRHRRGHRKRRRHPGQG
jgi:CubicO group peptidase (beta-lactamase class C family)